MEEREEWKRAKKIGRARARTVRRATLLPTFVTLVLFVPALAALILLSAMLKWPYNLAIAPLPFLAGSIFAFRVGMGMRKRLSVKDYLVG